LVDTGADVQDLDRVVMPSVRVNMPASVGGMSMFKNLNTDPKKKPRLVGELGDLSHAKVSSSRFSTTGTPKFSGRESLQTTSIR
jgi:hypothetical protein